VYLVFRLSRFLSQPLWLTVIYCALAPFAVLYLIPLIGLLVGVGNARRSLTSRGSDVRPQPNDVEAGHLEAATRGPAPPDYSQELERAISSVKASLRSSGNDQRPEWSTELERQLGELRRFFARDAIAFCVEKFVAAELDFEGRGDRGLGRLSSEIPRYGAYFRRELRRLAPSARDDLANAIRTQVLTGYLAFLLPRENAVTPSGITDGEALYQQWVPQIYSSALASSIDEKARTLLVGLGSDALNTHMDVLRRYQMTSSVVATNDKAEMMLFYYHVAGFGLRVVELLMARDTRA
jgi:hypothetical protein